MGNGRSKGTFDFFFKVRDRYETYLDEQALMHTYKQLTPIFNEAFAELGYNSLTGSQWLGMSAPKNLPAPIAQRITALIPELLAKPDVMAALEAVQTLPRKTPVVGDDFTKLIQSQINTWTAVAKRANVEVIV